MSTFRGDASHAAFVVLIAPLLLSILKGEPLAAMIGALTNVLLIEPRSG